MRSTYRGQLPKPDHRGYFRPEVGGVRFTLGHKSKISEGEAQRRLNALRDLFDLQCKRHEVDCWEPWLLGYAKRLAKGERSIDWQVSKLAQGNVEDAAEESMLIDELEALGFNVNLDDKPTISKGKMHLSKWLHGQLQQAVSDAIVQVKAQAADHYGPELRTPKIQTDNYETKTFHQAIDAFSKHLEVTGHTNQNGKLKTGVRKQIDRLRYLKDHHDDMPLWELTLPKLEEHHAYWRNRPETQKRSRCSANFAKDMMKELARFLRWLDKTPEFDWVMPKGADKVNRTPVKLPSDNQAFAFQTLSKQTYTPEQLGLILGHTDSLGKAIIATCVNCAFGQSEIGQWSTSKFILNHVHPHADKLDIESTEQDSWIVGSRPKSGVYGEHLLWPQVADIIKPLLDGREVLPISNSGNPWYRTHSANPQSSFGNWWNKLIDRVQMHYPDFPRLPFGSLRDTLPDVLRRRFSEDVASIALHHGKLGEDELLRCYANTPFKKLFDATRELQSYFEPMLKELTNRER